MKNSPGFWDQRWMSNKPDLRRKPFPCKEDIFLPGHIHLSEFYTISHWARVRYLFRI